MQLSLKHFHINIFLFTPTRQTTNTMTLKFLNQAHTGLQPARSWFLKIALSVNVSMCVCMCVRPKVINN